MLFFGLFLRQLRKVKIKKVYEYYIAMGITSNMVNDIVQKWQIQTRTKNWLNG